MGATAAKPNGICFVAMPYGADGERQRYEAWYDLVYEPAIKDIGAKPHPFWADKSPVSITKDIFEHLLTDELCIFDLAGLTPDAPPNANVMYELGIRHAFQLASVIYVWAGHNLPFDVNQQRSILMARDIVNVKQARADVAAALNNAKEGRFYNPLEGMARAQQIEDEAKHDPALKLLADNVSELAAQVRSLRNDSPRLTFSSGEFLTARDYSPVTIGGGNPHGLNTQIVLSPSTVFDPNAGKWSISSSLVTDDEKGKPKKK